MCAAESVAAGPSMRVRTCRGSDCNRLAATGYISPGFGVDWTNARTVGSAARPRVGPHPPVRLSGQSDSDGGGNASLLSSGRLVDLQSDPDRARELLR